MDNYTSHSNLPFVSGCTKGARLFIQWLDGVRVKLDMCLKGYIMMGGKVVGQDKVMPRFTRVIVVKVMKLAHVNFMFLRVYMADE